MRFLTAFLCAVVLFALSLYGVDCSAMVTPDQMMQCCNTMPCGSHTPGHEQNCCQKMRSLRAPYIQPSVEKTAVPTQVGGVVPTRVTLSAIASPLRIVTGFSHAPPISPQIVCSLPLRI